MPLTVFQKCRKQVWHDYSFKKFSDLKNLKLQKEIVVSNKQGYQLDESVIIVISQWQMGKPEYSGKFPEKWHSWMLRVKHLF